MLVLIRRFRDLPIPELMALRRQTMEEEAAKRPSLPRFFALEQAEQEYCRYLAEVFFRTPGAVYALWKEKDAYVSALRLEPYRDGMLLAGLETAPEHRGKGYARDLIRAVQALPDCGKLYSHVSRKNHASLKTHEACGFRVISDHAVYISGSVDYRSVTLCFEV